MKNRQLRARLAKFYDDYNVVIVIEHDDGQETVHEIELTNFVDDFKDEEDRIVIWAKPSKIELNKEVK